MASRKRYFESGHIYHVLNRGAQRQQLFFSEDDYRRFEALIEETVLRIPLPIFSYELMPNHWHFVVKPNDQEQLSGFFGYLAGTHGKRFRAAHGTTGQGHVYQDRFKSFPIECDGHFLAVCRYVERNALHAGLVRWAEAWRWSALWRRQHALDQWLISDWPVPCPSNWIDRVNQPLKSVELAMIETSIRRQTPLGTPNWVRCTAVQLGLEHTLRRCGRPRIVATRSA